MRKGYKFLLIPVALFPYLTLLTLILILDFGRNDFSTWVMTHLFRNNVFLLLALLLLIALAAVICGAAFFLLSRKQEWDLPETAGCAMVVKLAQVPVHLILFVLGILFTIGIWTIPFALVLLWLNCWNLLATGLCQAGAVLAGYRQGLLTRKEATRWILSQFFFCADVIGSVCFYRKLKKIRTE